MSTTQPMRTEPLDDLELDAPGASGTAPAAEGELASSRWRRPGTWSLVPLGLLALAVVLVGLHVREYSLVSPIDELQHIDYALKVSKGELVRRGDHEGQEAMREEACRGLDNPMPIPSCEAPSYDPADFQEEGFNTAYAHPPGYYWVSGVGGRLLAALPGVGGPVTGARLMGAAWLGVGLIATWYALGELSIRASARIAVLVLVASAPTVLLFSATVNPDATSLAVGALTLLIVLRWEAGRASPWLLAIVAAAAMATKATNLVGVGAGVLYIVIRWLQARHDAREVAHTLEPGPAAGGPSARLATRPVIGMVAIALIAGAVTGGAWAIATDAMARVDAMEIPMAQRFYVDRITMDEVIDNVPAGLSPLRQPYLPAMIDGAMLRVAVFFTDLLLVAGVVAALLMSAARSRLRALAGATLAWLVLLGPFFVIFDFFATHAYFVVPPRYGLVLVPFIAAAVAAACERTRPGLALLWGVAGFSLITMVAAIV
jgi:4-amino-4-deoxy-L-arabinose transferase-like glycosyltransferase